MYLEPVLRLLQPKLSPKIILIYLLVKQTQEYQATTSYCAFQSSKPENFTTHRYLLCK